MNFGPETERSNKMASRAHKPVDPNVKLSKSLSWLLRHGAEKEGFTLMKGGFLYLEDIQRHPKFRNATIDDIQRVVENSDKQRFALETDGETGKLKIRANQGHSLQVDDLDLQPILDADQFPTVIHGTDKRAFQFIAKQGLKRMNRNHIHFAAGEPGEDGIISGMRHNCSVIIFVDLKRALDDGFKFFQSANKVILCPGNGEGILPTTYFHKVLDRVTRQKLHFDQNTANLSSPVLDSDQSPACGIPSETGASSVTVSADSLADEFEGQKRSRKKKS